MHSQSEIILKYIYKHTKVKKKMGSGWGPKTCKVNDVYEPISALQTTVNKI